MRTSTGSAARCAPRGVSCSKGVPPLRPAPGEMPT